MLTLYREALRIRRSGPLLEDGPMTWVPSPEGVLAFDRARGADGADGADGAGTDPDGGLCVRCIANISGEPVPFPPNAAVLLASGPLDAGLLPPDTTAWLRIE
jgi:alpha-glucosidase